VQFQTKPEIAVDLVKQVLAMVSRAVLGDESMSSGDYGGSSPIGLEYSSMRRELQAWTDQ